MRFSIFLAFLSVSQLALATEPAIDCGDAELVVSTIASDTIQYSCFDESTELRIVLLKGGIRVYDGSRNHAGEQDGWFEMHNVEGGVYLRGTYRNGKRVGKWEEYNFETGGVDEVIYPD